MTTARDGVLRWWSVLRRHSHFIISSDPQVQQPFDRVPRLLLLSLRSTIQCDSQALIAATLCVPLISASRLLAHRTARHHSLCFIASLSHRATGAARLAFQNFNRRGRETHRSQPLHSVASRATADCETSFSFFPDSHPESTCASSLETSTPASLCCRSEVTRRWSPLRRRSLVVRPSPASRAAAAAAAALAPLTE